MRKVGELEFLISDMEDDRKIETEYSASLLKRCNEVEDAMEKGYGIQVRTEINQKVETDFTKLEMVTIMAGVDKLYTNSKNRDDVEFYIALSKKIEKIVEKMEE
jgi:hypothetical protein